MKHIKRYIPIILLALFPACSSSDYSAIETGQYPQIFPDYTDLTLPPNLAPLNFRVEEEGEGFHVKIYAEKGQPIDIRQSAPNIRIPLKKWKALLQENVGESIYVSVRVYAGGAWQQYKTICHRIAAEAIDPYLYYRDIVPTNSLWNRMEMHQRNLENFTEEKVLDNYRIGHNCMNCHTFNRNNPAQMLFHIRGNHGGTVIYKEGELEKIDFPLPEIISAGAYCNWHPEGRLIAFAVNKIKQNYYLSGYGDKMKEVYDLESDIVLYDTETHTVTAFPQIASAKRENLPCWSPDGRQLYFVSAEPYAVSMTNEEQLYSLMQVAYDRETHQLGEPEILLDSDSIQGSISFPAVSPDGKYMLFCVADFGYFPVNNKSADLYLMDMQTKAYHRLPVNSKESESYISWSDNSRWFVFSSRRLDGMTSKPYICHIDPDGRVSKPFVIPQKEGDYYRIDHRNFSRPELLKARLPISFADMEAVIFSEPQMATYENKINNYK